MYILNWKYETWMKLVLKNNLVWYNIERVVFWVVERRQKFSRKEISLDYLNRLGNKLLVSVPRFWQDCSAWSRECVCFPPCLTPLKKSSCLGHKKKKIWERDIQLFCSTSTSTCDMHMTMETQEELLWCHTQSIMGDITGLRPGLSQRKWKK